MGLILAFDALNCVLPIMLKFVVNCALLRLISLLPSALPRPAAPRASHLVDSAGLVRVLGVVVVDEVPGIREVVGVVLCRVRVLAFLVGLVLKASMPTT